LRKIPENKGQSFQNHLGGEALISFSKKTLISGDPLSCSCFLTQEGVCSLPKGDISIAIRLQQDLHREGTGKFRLNSKTASFSCSNTEMSGRKDSIISTDIGGNRGDRGKNKMKTGEKKKE
jgi:hypothetical protein